MRKESFHHQQYVDMDQKANKICQIRASSYGTLLLHCGDGFVLDSFADYLGLVIFE